MNKSKLSIFKAAITSLSVRFLLVKYPLKAACIFVAFEFFQCKDRVLQGPPYGEFEAKSMSLIWPFPVGLVGKCEHWDNVTLTADKRSNVACNKESVVVNSLYKASSESFGMIEFVVENGFVGRNGDVGESESASNSRKSKDADLLWVSSDANDGVLMCVVLLSCLSSP